MITFCIKHSWMIALIALGMTSLHAQESGSAAGSGQLEAAPYSQRPYAIQAKDTIEVRVFEEPDLSFQQRVDSDGQIVVPLLGKLTVGEMTVREAESYIERRYIEEQILLDPQVTVDIVSYSIKQYYVFGEVRAPGMKTFPPETTSLDIIQVISLAGDFTEFARRSAVEIKRVGENGEEATIEVDVEDIIEGKASLAEEAREKYRIYPNDIVFVPERFM